MKKLEELSTIHVVPYSHHDHAWTNTRQWHIWRYIEGFCQVLDTMKEDPGYTLAIDNVLHSLDAFYRYCPSRVEEFVARVKEGRICVANGGMALVRPADFDGELLIRNGCEGRRELCARFGLKDIALYFNADTACGASQMPQLLRLMGHRYYRFMRPEQALKRMGVPFQFRWRGMDGSEIIVGRGEYGACMFNEWAVTTGDWPTRRDAFVREELESRLCCDLTDELLLNVGQDDCLPKRDIRDRYYPLDDMMREWNRKEPSRMEYSTFDRFFEAIERKELPVWEGPLDECELAFNAAIRVDASLRKARLLSERLLLVCERLDAMAVWLGASGREAELSALWKRLFDFSGHAMQHLLDRDYVEVRDDALATVALLRQLRRSLLDEIALRTGCVGRVSQVVVNPTLNGGRRIVELHVATPHHIDGLRLTDSSGRELEWQLLETFRGDKPYDCQFNEVRVAAKLEVPPLGYCSVRVECDGRKLEAPVTIDVPDGYVIDNGAFRAVVRGGMISEVWTANGAVVQNRPLVQPVFAATKVTWSYPGDWTPLRTDRLEVESAKLVEAGPLRWRIAIRGRVGASAVSLTQTIERDSPVIDCAMELDNREGEGYYALDLPCAADAQIFAAVPFGEETRDPAKQVYFEPEGPNAALEFERGWRYALFAGGYASFRSGAGRLLLLQGDCAHLMCAEPGAGVVRQLLYRSFEQAARTDEWVKHICPDFEGRGLQHFEFAVAVLPVEHDMAHAQALLQNQRAPLGVQVRYSMEPGVAAPDGSLLQVDCDHVQLSAVCRSEETMTVRLYECGGRTGTVRMSLPEGFASARAVDLKGDLMEKTVTVEGGTAVFSVLPHEIVTLQVEQGEKTQP